VEAHDLGVALDRLSPLPSTSGAAEADVQAAFARLDITILTEGDPVRATLRAGSVFIVPQGLWHRQLARTPVTLLTATPTPTDHSDAADPRAGG